MEDQKIKIPLSNAFKQGRRLRLTKHKSIDQNIRDAKQHGASYKHISQAAQAAANIHKKHKADNEYFTKLARKARYEGHIRESGKYNLKYPKSSITQYEKQAGQQKLKG